MNRIKAPQKIIIPPHNVPQFQQNGSALLGCVSARKRKSTFVTQKKLSPQQMVLESHNQLIQYVNQLQIKVHKIIQTHDSQFLLAYRSHLNRVRQEMQQLKNKNAKNANSASTHTQKIQSLQKQLVLFRQQALKLFQKLTQKDKNIELLNIKIYQLQTEQKFNKRTITDLMKRNKYLEGLVRQFKQNKQKQGNLNLQTVQKKNVSFFDGNSLKKYSSQQKPDKNQRNKNFSLFISQHDSQKQSRRTTTALRSKRTTIAMNATTYNPKQALQNYFLQSAAHNINFKKY